MNKDRPAIGILCWEAGSYSRALRQLEELPGNSTNPDTFDFPVRYCRIKGANVHTVVDNPSRDLILAMIRQARLMEAEGVKAITTSCGFNAVFQKELADSVSIPVFTSALLQVPMVHCMLQKDEVVGIITSHKPSLTNRHLENVGVDDTVPLNIEGMESCPAWRTLHTTPDTELDIAQVEKDIINLACAMKTASKIGAFVLECTDLPPFAQAIRKATRCPVFDFVTLTRFVYEAVRST